MSKKPATNLQRLVAALRDSLQELGAQASEAQLEAWSVLIHASMSGRGRNFHSVQHVFDVAEGCGPLQTIAALFHDTVYYQVDGGFSHKQAEVLRGVVQEADDGVTLAPFSRDDDPLLAALVGVFGFSAGQVLSPFAGLNEFLSALLAGRTLDGTLSLTQLVQLGACIEATIPFRKADADGKGPSDKLFARLSEVNEAFALDLSPDELAQTVHQATDLANQDVGNFGTTDRAWFLDNTWKLLPESNIPLRHGGLYTMSEYQLALKKMEGFFSFLDPGVIFGSFRDEPDAATLESMTSRARRNIEVGRRYLRAKLLAMSLLASLAQRTGGDAPVALFMGDLPSDERRTDRLEDFLTVGEPTGAVDKEVFELLAEGRKTDSQFDLRNSPLAAYLYARLGDDGLDAALEHAVHPMQDEHAAALLAALPKEVVAEVASGCAKIGLTRQGALEDLAR